MFADASAHRTHDAGARVSAERCRYGQGGGRLSAVAFQLFTGSVEGCGTGTLAWIDVISSDNVTDLSGTRTITEGTGTGDLASAECPVRDRGAPERSARLVGLDRLIPTADDRVMRGGPNGSVVAVAVGLLLAGCSSSAQRVTTEAAGQKPTETTAVVSAPHPPIPPTIPPGGLDHGRREVGITDDHQAPFSNTEFGVINQYSGPYGDQWVNIYAGGHRRVEDMSFVGGGGVRVYVGPADSYYGGPHYVGEFDTPDAPTWVKIVAVNDKLVTLVREDGTQTILHLDTGGFS